MPFDIAAVRSPTARRHLRPDMGTIPVWIKRTQTAGLIVTGAAIGYYYVAPALRVEEVSLPANTLLAKARMFGTDGKKKVTHSPPF